MPTPGVKPRRYVSSLRSEQARGTRRRVIAEARRLLLERGYAGVTMAEVAAAAQVSVPLLYKAFGAKPALVKQVYDVTLAGDDAPQAVADRPDVARLVAEPDPAVKLSIYAAMARGMAGRAGDLVNVLRFAARAGDPDLQDFLATTDAERLVGATRLAGHLAAAGALRPGLDVDEARDLVWLATAPENFQLLVRERGWSLDAYERWLHRTLVRSLLPVAPVDG